ncbi:hypothetical protein RM533_07100 [Croceicoccus sp. F390]|uniref:Uncharacterized protein n=1 Tax=Croceicoccus esteveae TaxID=3075597 RepID=A0ABU2ZH72_9SPHN|nr:hypothetical protein [Croceicoccus sp. F390]MDT0575950.1 hypothetical protein [Croceicoccus sp. F390]
MTGPQVLGFADVAQTITRELGARPVHCDAGPVSGLLFEQVGRSKVSAMSLLMAALYPGQRLGKAAPVLREYTRLTDCLPEDPHGFVHRICHSFIVRSPASLPEANAGPRELICDIVRHGGGQSNAD